MTTLQLTFSGIPLPFELLHQIGWNLTLKDLATCLRVCQAWHQILQSDPFWKPLCERDFSLISQQKTDYQTLYRRFHHLQSSLLINPQPITLKGLKSHNPQLISIYTGKTGTLPNFIPTAEIPEGTAIKNEYKKVSKHPSKEEKWIGKIGEPLGILNSDSYSTKTRSKIEMGIDSMREKLASDLYQELGRELFIVPKTRISSQDVVNSYSERYREKEPWIFNNIPHCLRIMSCFMEGYQDLTHAFVMKNVSFLEFLKANSCLPPTILTPQREKSVPLQSLSLLLPNDLKKIPEEEINSIAILWIHDQHQHITQAQAIKVDPHTHTPMGFQDLNQAQTPEKITFEKFVHTHRCFPKEILDPQGFSVPLNGLHQLPDPLYPEKFELG